MRAPKTLFVAFLVLAVLSASRPAFAESTLVVLVRPGAGTPKATAVLYRVRGELAADGFGVVLLNAVPETEREVTLLREGRARGAPVTAGVFIADDAGVIELWLLDTVSGRVLARRLEPEPGTPDQAPEVLARRSVDVLRASLLDFLVDSLREAAATTKAVPAAPSPSHSQGAEVLKDRWALEGGLGVLASFDGLGPAVLPVLRAHFAPLPVLHLRLTGAGLGTQPSVQAPTGSATVEQGIALAECTARPFGGPILPFASVGAGAYYVGVNGATNTPPYQGKRSDTVAFVLEAGIGVAVKAAARLEVVLEADGLVLDPGVEVFLLRSNAAKIGRPSVLGTMTLVGWL